jgi:hypothetical protein
MAKKPTPPPKAGAAKPVETATARKPKTRRKSPGRTPDAELEERARLTASLLGQGRTKGDIKKALATKYNVDHHTAERYLGRAREILLAELRETRDYHKSSALEFYRSVLVNSEATIRDKIAAQKRIDFILGLHAPSRVAVTDTDGNDIDPSEIDSKIVALLAQINEPGREG